MCAEYDRWCRCDWQARRASDIARRLLLPQPLRIAAHGVHLTAHDLSQNALGAAQEATAPDRRLGFGFELGRRPCAACREPDRSTGRLVTAGEERIDSRPRSVAMSATTPRRPLATSVRLSGDCHNLGPVVPPTHWFAGTTCGPSGTPGLSDCFPRRCSTSLNRWGRSSHPRSLLQVASTWHGSFAPAP
jgi:hypothetical protein